MPDLTYVAYCGLYCKLCSTLSRIPKQASALHNTLKNDGYEYLGPHVIAGFKEFWAGLKQLSNADQHIKGCRGGCGDPGCKIRKCAHERNVELCSFCNDFPCNHINQLAKRYPNLIPDGKRQQEIGLDKWIQEQEDRVETGFCYCDIRYTDIVNNKNQTEI